MYAKLRMFNDKRGKQKVEESIEEVISVLTFDE
jgi:hypothetical protein